MTAPRTLPAPPGPPLARDDGRWHYRRSLASRVILLTTVAVGLAVAFVALGAFLTARQQMQSTLDESLLNRARKAASTEALARIQVANDFEVPSWALGAADIRIFFVTPGRIFSPDSEGPDIELGSPEVAVADGSSGSSIRTVAAGSAHYRVVAVPSGEGQALVLAQSMGPQEKVLAHLGVVMLLFGLAGVVAAAAAGWAVARNGLRPVRRLTGSVEKIARTEQLTQMPVEGDDEIARLTTAFNQMLGALAASQERQRRLVADAGHELRTPLTSLRTNLELLAQADADLAPEARAELLADVRAQIEELSTLVGDLVELARDEPISPVVQPVELADVVDHALARVRRRAPGLTFAVDVEPWEVLGDSAGLERAVTNLLDNAAKWSPPGGTVSVGLREGRLTVDDEGPGIDEADVPHVFERFWRSDESRQLPGSGLGLSIVAQVAARHDGTATVERSPSGGARLVLVVPGRSVSPAADERSSDTLVP